MLNLIDEIYNLVSVERDTHSGLYSLQMPTQLDLIALYTRLGIRQPIPDWSDPIWLQINERVRARMPNLRACADRLYHICSPLTRPATQVRPVFSATSEETRIRQMSGQDALAECLSKSIEVTPHPTNKGITAMRAKNALLYVSRKRLN